MPEDIKMGERWQTVQCLKPTMHRSISVFTFLTSLGFGVIAVVDI